MDEQPNLDMDTFQGYENDDNSPQGQTDIPEPTDDGNNKDEVDSADENEFNATNERQSTTDAKRDQVISQAQAGVTIDFNDDEQDQ